MFLVGRSEEMAKAGESAEEAIQRGLEIAHRIVKRLERECEGFCVSAPLGRVEVALRLAKEAGL